MDNCPHMHDGDGKGENPDGTELVAHRTDSTLNMVQRYEISSACPEDFEGMDLERLMFTMNPFFYLAFTSSKIFSLTYLTLRHVH
jgi:hypothetical protein